MNMIKTDSLLISPTDKKSLWVTPWKVELRKDDKKQIGTVKFEGEAQKGAVSVRIELDEEYRNKGYGTEVFREMVHWAFLHNDIYTVQAVTDHDNDKCINALEKAGFVRRDYDRETEWYTIEKPKTAWIGVYVVIGIYVGLILGIVVRNPALGLFIGMTVCCLIGSIMDNKELQHREEVTGKEVQFHKIKRSK